MKKESTLRLRKFGIDSYKKAIIYMRYDCPLCASEGFKAHTRVEIKLRDASIIANINIIKSDVLKTSEAFLSEYAWKLLDAKEGDELTIKHAKPAISFSFVRSKIYDNVLKDEEMKEIIKDIAGGHYSDIQISSFLTTCAGKRITNDEVISLTKAMIDVGNKLSWNSEIVVDKHSIGGLPGNRTTPIIVAIVSAFGLAMPKTSARSITSPAGTADTMEVLTPVTLDLEEIRKVVDKENGCVVWGETAILSPADDILIRVERNLDLDSEGQMVASILSKKIAAGSNHVVIDMPVGETAKVRSEEMANLLKNCFEEVAKALSIKIKIVITDGSQPVGRGIGPALEARDLVQVLQNDPLAPKSLRNRALMLAGEILEFSPKVKKGEGIKVATEILDSGKAWQKFQAICEAQGGMREIPKSAYNYDYLSNSDGVVSVIDNRRIALVAKLAGAPYDKAAGIDLNVKIGDKVKKGDLLFTIHSESTGTLEYVLNYLEENLNPITIQL